ncbi:hypothetical protein Tco_0545961 [Tanacetum coccineum]
MDGDRAIVDPCILIMPLYGDGDLITMKFIQAVVECSLLPTITGNRSCPMGHIFSPVKPVSTVVAGVYLTFYFRAQSLEAHVRTVCLLMLHHQVTWGGCRGPAALILDGKWLTTALSHNPFPTVALLECAMVGVLGKGCTLLRVFLLGLLSSGVCTCRSPAAPLTSGSVVATATLGHWFGSWTVPCGDLLFEHAPFSYPPREIANGPGVNASEPFGVAMDGTYLRLRLHDVCLVSSVQFRVLVVKVVL